MDRQIAFQRKAPPAPPAEEMAEGEGESMAGVECPNCQCQFDPDTQEVLAPGKPVEGGGYDEGSDLTLPGVESVSQAPAGMDAVTNAVAQALGQHQ